MSRKETNASKYVNAESSVLCLLLSMDIQSRASVTYIASIKGFPIVAVSGQSKI